jgi:hypothetical protein
MKSVRDVEARLYRGCALNEYGALQRPPEEIRD